MLHDEREHDPPDTLAVDKGLQSHDGVTPPRELAAGVPDDESLCDDGPLSVQARPTPLPRVDGALLGLSVLLLQRWRPPPRNFCPPPLPPGAPGADALAPAQPDLAQEDGSYLWEDSSISLIERIEGVSAPISSRPQSWSISETTESHAQRARRRQLAWIGVAAGVVHCMVLALILSPPIEPKITDEQLFTTSAQGALSGLLAQGRVDAAEPEARSLRARAQALQLAPASAVAAERMRSIEPASHARGRRHHVASLSALKRKRRHASGMR